MRDRFRSARSFLGYGLGLLAAVLVTAHADSAGDPSKTLAQGKGWSISRADLDKTIKRVQTELMSNGNTVDEGRWEEFEGRLLDQMILVQITRMRATEADRTVARTNADAFIHEVWSKSGSDTDYERRLGRAGYTRDGFSQEKYDEALVNAIIARELKTSIQISPEAIQKAYDSHPERWKTPESVRVAQLLFTARNPITGVDLSPDVMEGKLRKLTELRDEARKPGADFGQLVRDYSEDVRTKANGGEMIVFRKQTFPEFESACFSLVVNQVSDVVTSAAGFHLIKCLERRPASIQPLEKVSTDLRAELVEQETLKQLPAYAERIRREAGLILSPDAPKLPPNGPGRPPAKS